MLIIALVLSLIFGSLGFTVTKNNARYLLSGYNTMSEADRSTIDIETYLKFFKRFHIFLGLSLFMGILVMSQVNKNWASLFMTTYPILAYIYFMVYGQKFYTAVSTRKKAATYVVVGILVLTVVLIGRQGFLDYRSSKLILNREELVIEGSYGVKLKRQDIHGQELVNELPPVSYKSNGFAAGDYAKGSFRLTDGKTVRLFVDRKISPTLLLHTAKGTIYYNTDELEMNHLNEKIMRWRQQ